MHDLFNDYFCYKFPQPQYLGAKYKHLGWIGRYIPHNITSVLDAFSGSQSVAYFFKQKGLQVYTNDFLNFNHQIGLALIENKIDLLNKEDVSVLMGNNKDPNNFNLMENLFSDLFFTREECRFLDSFRSNIDNLSGYKKALAFSIMNRSITRKVTMGHFAHTKALDYASNPDRIKRNRSLIRPLQEIFMDLYQNYNKAVFDNGQNNKSFNADAIDIIVDLASKVDLLYLDPPYCGSHADYQSFYHLLETFTVYWKDKEFINGTKKYYPPRKCGFDIKGEALESFSRLFDKASKIPYWLISYNDRSYPSKEEMLFLIRKHKNVIIAEKEYQNNVGGKGSVKGSSELLFVCTPKEK